MELNFLYIGWIAFGVVLTVAIQLYFFKPKGYSEEYESKINSICLAFKNRLFHEIDELYKKKQEIENKQISKKHIFPEIQEDLVLYKLDDVLYYSSKYNRWNDALKDGKKYLKNIGKGIFIFGVILLVAFHFLCTFTDIDFNFLIFFIYIGIIPLAYSLKNAQLYDKITKQIDNGHSLVKKGDLKGLLKKTS